MSVMAIKPDTAFVKGGLFPKMGIAIPPPAVQLFMKRCEKWEIPFEGAKVLMEQGR